MMGKLIIINLLLTFLLSSLPGCSKDDNDNTINEEPVAGNTYYVAPDGDDNNKGTIDNPWATWQKAFNVAEAGDTVYFREGIWKPTTSQPSPWQSAVTKIAPHHSTAEVGHDGKSGYPICFFNYPSEVPILDCSSIVTTTNYNTGISLLQVNFVKFRGLTIRNVYQTRENVECFGIGASDCSNLSFENITVHNVHGNAFRFAGAFGYYPDITFDTTVFINCDAYNCCDSLKRTSTGNPNLGGAADGYKTWNEPGAFFLFEGCRSWNNSDDGFDPGASATVVINNCWSFGNGYLDGDGVGFKTGGNIAGVQSITRLVTNCIAVSNRAQGFFLLEYKSYYRTNALFLNNLSYENEYGFTFSINDEHPTVLGVWKNNIAYKNTILPISNAYQQYTESHNTWDRVEGYPGCVETDSLDLTDDDFVNLDISELSRTRQPDGSLPDINFGRLVEESDLKGAGTYVGMSLIPDIGIDWPWLDSR
jgi:hypothetical protein